MLIMNFFSRISRHNLNNWTRKLIRRFHRMSRKRGRANDSAKTKLGSISRTSLAFRASWASVEQRKVSAEFFISSRLPFFCTVEAKGKMGNFYRCGFPAVERKPSGADQSGWRPSKRSGPAPALSIFESNNTSWTTVDFVLFFILGGGRGGFKSVSSGSSTHRRHHGPHTTLSLFYENEST